MEEFAPKAILQNVVLTVDYRVSFGVKGVRTVGFALIPPLPLVLAPKSPLTTHFALFPATSSTAALLPSHPSAPSARPSRCHGDLSAP